MMDGRIGGYASSVSAFVVMRAPRRFLPDDEEPPEWLALLDEGGRGTVWVKTAVMGMRVVTGGNGLAAATAGNGGVRAASSMCGPGVGVGVGASGVRRGPSETESARPPTGVEAVVLAVAAASALA